MSIKELKKTSAEVEDDARSEDLARDPERQQKSTPGVGTDIFVRKKKPGSQVGKGYFVDIYENGVKIDTIELTTKKDVTKLIRKFKDKYNTDRAFQNEMQVHITYKTKKERGEQTMASIDTILIKKANIIQKLLNKVTEPDLPLIKRFGQDEMLENVSSVPETPPTGTEDKENIKRYIADEIVKKFTTFVKKKEEESGNISEPAPPVNDYAVANQQVKTKQGAIDDLFNPLRKWYSTLSREIQKWNNMSNNMLSEDGIRDIVNQSEKIILSKNPELIQKNTGISISPETANIMYEVGSKSVGKPGEAEKGGELGGNPADFQEEDQLKAAKSNEKMPTIEDTNDLLESFTKQVQTQGNTVPITDLAKDLNIVDNDILQKMHSILSEKDDLVEAEAAIKKYIEDHLNLERKSSLHPSILESKAKEFWKYAGDYKGIANIEDVFVDWIKKTGYEIKEASNIWKKVSNDIMKAFNFDIIKTADATKAVGDIVLTTAEGNIFSGWLEYRSDLHDLVLNTSVEPGYEKSPAFKYLQSIAPTRETILNEEQLNAAVPVVLERLASLETIKNIARPFWGTVSSETPLAVTTTEREGVGGAPINQKTYNYTITPYGEDVYYA